MDTGFVWTQYRIRKSGNGKVVQSCLSVAKASYQRTQVLEPQRNSLGRKNECEYTGSIVSIRWLAFVREYYMGNEGCELGEVNAVR